MKDLVPFPPVLKISVCNDLKSRDDCPARPHEPSVQSRNFFELTRCLTTSIAIQDNVEEAVVVAMESKLVWAVSFKGVNHTHSLVQWNDISIFLSWNK